MTLLYRPTGVWPSAQELWARCDLCSWSGPWAAFDFLDNDQGGSLEICRSCFNDETVDWLSLWRKGYRCPER